MDEKPWQLPIPDRILDPAPTWSPNQAAMRRQISIVEDTLNSFGIPAGVIEVNTGPRETHFLLAPIRARRGSRRASAFTVSKIRRRASDLALSLAVPQVTVEPGEADRQGVVLRVPNPKAEAVLLRTVLEPQAFARLMNPLKLGLGLDACGAAVSADLGSMPHLLIAGTAGSGKSICIHALIAALLLQNTPDTLRFVMVDTKRVELGLYDGIPHLMMPVIMESGEALAALPGLKLEAEKRFKHLAELGARDLSDYNMRRRGEDRPSFPYIVVIVDEIADLAWDAPKALEEGLGSLAQVGRQAGIHLIVSTSRPSIDIVARSLKGNFPTRIALRVTSAIESRIILDRDGAERLLGRGDMLLLRPDMDEPIRIQGAFVSDSEIQRIADYWCRAAQARESSPENVDPPPNGPTH